MKIQLFQIKYRNKNFEYNYENIINQQMKPADLYVFPEVETNSSMNFDSKYNDAKDIFFEKLCKHFTDKTVLVGKYLIKNGELFNVNNQIINIDNQNIYVSDEYKEPVDCDIYILAKNRYYTKNGLSDFADVIQPNCKFIHVNSIMIDEENVYSGQSFIKNEQNDIVELYPLLEEKSEEADFAKVIGIEEFDSTEEFYKVITYYIKEYCEICGFKQVILGLSGGIDSALVATLAAAAIGAENVYTIMLPSKYSSEGSMSDSEKLVKNLGINVETIPIKSMFDCFMQDVAKASKMDLAEENLQSRLRGLILMFNSNRYNRLLLSTGNKSEIACGYGTLYGDMCGGLNPIADLTKTNVYKLSNWINRNGEIIPAEIINKAPSAELRPNQKDSDSLPEYEILDQIIEDYIENQLSYEELIKKFDKDLVDKTLHLIYRAQFKRNQACLGVRLTENAFCANVKLPVTQNIY